MEDMTMIRTIYWYLHFGLSLGVKSFEMIKVNRLKKQGKIAELEDYIHQTASKWALSQVKASGANVTVKGRENIPKDGAVVFISNHQSNFDIALLMSYIDKPKGYIAKVEMKKIPIMKTWMEYMHCVFIERDNPKKSLQAILEGVKMLKAGYSLVIFPEGTRSKSNKIGTFKPGSLKLATKAQVPIIPVTIDGTYKLMEQNGGKIKSADVTVIVHSAIETKGLTKEELDELPEKIYNIIKDAL